MSRTEDLTRLFGDLNAGRVRPDDELFHPDLTFHAPGLGWDLAGRDAVMGAVNDLLEQGQLRYRLHQVVEHGPFAVAFATSTGMLDGERKTWELCQVARYADDRIAELWTLRGGEPVPVGTDATA